MKDEQISDIAPEKIVIDTEATPSDVTPGGKVLSPPVSRSEAKRRVAMMGSGALASAALINAAQTPRVHRGGSVSKHLAEQKGETPQQVEYDFVLPPEAPKLDFHKLLAIRRALQSLDGATRRVSGRQLEKKRAKRNRRNAVAKASRKRNR